MESLALNDLKVAFSSVNNKLKQVKDSQDAKTFLTAIAGEINKINKELLNYIDLTVIKRDLGEFKRSETNNWESRNKIYKDQSLPEDLRNLGIQKLIVYQYKDDRSELTTDISIYSKEDNKDAVLKYAYSGDLNTDITYDRLKSFKVKEVDVKDRHASSVIYDKTLKKHDVPRQINFIQGKYLELQLGHKDQLPLYALDAQSGPPETHHPDDTLWYYRYLTNSGWSEYTGA